VRAINQKLKFNNIIVIDANFILLPFQFKIDYFSEITFNLEGKTRFIVFKQVLDELEAKKRRMSKSVKFKKHFESGLLYIEKNKNKYDITFVENIKNDNESTDNFLLRSSIDLKRKNNLVYLATNDSELRKKAKKEGINLIFLRQKKFLFVQRN